MHWKLCVMTDRNHHTPVILAVEFDTHKAADLAAAFYRRGGYDTDVIKDDEADDYPVEAAVAEAAE
jgi:hypothetical protein